MSAGNLYCTRCRALVGSGVLCRCQTARPADNRSGNHHPDEADIKREGDVRYKTNRGATSKKQKTPVGKWKEVEYTFHDTEAEAWNCEAAARRLKELAEEEKSKCGNCLATDHPTKSCPRKPMSAEQRAIRRQELKKLEKDMAESKQTPSSVVALAVRRDFYGNVLYCINCLSNQHDVSACMQEGITAKHREQIRLGRDLPIGALPKGVKLEPCDICWGRTRHWHPSRCPEPLRTVPEREALRRAMGAPMTPNWERTLRNFARRAPMNAPAAVASASSTEANRGVRQTCVEPTKVQEGPSGVKTTNKFTNASNKSPPAKAAPKNDGYLPPHLQRPKHVKPTAAVKKVPEPPRRTFTLDFGQSGEITLQEVSANPLATVLNTQPPASNLNAQPSSVSQHNGVFDILTERGFQPVQHYNGGDLLLDLGHNKSKNDDGSGEGSGGSETEPKEEEDRSDWLIKF